MNIINIIIIGLIIYICYVYLCTDVDDNIEKFKAYNINISNDNCGILNRQITTPWYYYSPYSYYYPYSYVNPFQYMYPPFYY